MELTDHPTFRALLLIVAITMMASIGFLIAYAIGMTAWCYLTECNAASGQTLFQEVWFGS